MKKLLKKVAMALCTMAVTIGFVGGTASESAAATFGGTSTVTVETPYNFSPGRLTITSSCGGSTSGKILGIPNTQTFKISGKSSKKNDKVTLTATYYNSNGKKVDSSKITVKVTDLGKKSFKIKLSTNLGNYIKKVKISKK